MKKMFNERHAYMEEVPNELEVLRELDKRVSLSAELKQKLTWLENKAKGLNKVLELLDKHGKDQWLYMTNVAMDYHSIINCDLLVMTSTHVYTLGVNAYEGTFEYKDGISRLNGEILNEHPIPMAQSVFTQLQSFKTMSPTPIDLKLKGAVLFTEPNQSLEIDAQVKDIEVVPAERLEKFVRGMVQEEKQARKKGSSFNPLNLSWIMRIDRHHPYIPLEIPDEIMTQVQKGILCKHCGSSAVKIGEVLMTCECGGWESVEEAILRTAYEYCNLTNAKYLDVPSICEFFDEQLSTERVRECLEQFIVAIK